MQFHNSMDSFGIANSNFKFEYVQKNTNSIQQKD